MCELLFLFGEQRAHPSDHVSDRLERTVGHLDAVGRHLVQGDQGRAQFAHSGRRLLVRHRRICPMRHFEINNYSLSLSLFLSHFYFSKLIHNNWLLTFSAFLFERLGCLSFFSQFICNYIFDKFICLFFLHYYYNMCV